MNVLPGEMLVTITGDTLARATPKATSPPTGYATPHHHPDPPHTSAQPRPTVTTHP